MKSELQRLPVGVAGTDFENRSVRDHVIDHESRSFEGLKVFTRAPRRYQNAQTLRANTPHVLRKKAGKATLNS